MLSAPELAALGAAFCWSVSGVISAGPVRHLGPQPYVRIRMSMVLATLVLWLLVQGDLSSQVLQLPLSHWLRLALSGVIGIWFGDVMLFMCMNRVGPRRSAILFAINAPMQVALGIFFLGESISAMGLIGCGLVVFGTYLAIVFGKRKSQIHQWEEVQGLLIMGVLFGLMAALGQALGALVAKPVLEMGVTAVGATTIRVGAAVLMLWACWLLPLPNQKAANRLNLNTLLVTFVSGLLAMSIGMSLLLYALKHGDLGITAILSSVSTTLMLPMLWLVTKERPAAGAWGGAILVVIGISAIKLG